MSKKLTPKQQKFADNYIETGNATQSALEAGYAPKAAYQTGAENLKKPQIKAYIDAQMNILSKGHIMSAQEILERLTRIAIGEETETVIVSGPWGVDKEQKPADTKTQILAMKEIMKRYPDNDELVKQQIRKLKAEADIAEAKVKVLQNDNDEQMDAISNILNKIDINVKEANTDESHSDE